MLDYVCQHSVLGPADTSRYRAVFGERLFDFESDHAVVCCIGLCRKEVIDLYEAFLAVVVICVDDRERGIDVIAGRKYGLACAPWLCASFRKSESFRKIVAFLERVMDVIFFSGAAFDVSSEDFFEVVLYYEADSSESGLISIIQTEVHDDVALIRDLVELLVAAVSAAHAGSHDY